EIDETANTCQGAAQQVCQELGTSDVDAQHICTVHIATHSIEVPTQFTPTEQNKQHNHNQKRNHHTRLYIRRHIFTQLIDRTHAGNINPGSLQSFKCLMLDIELGCVDNGSHTFGKEHTSQRHNKGLNFQIGNQVALNQTECNADSQSQQHSGNDTAAVIVQ